MRPRRRSRRRAGEDPAARRSRSARASSRLRRRRRLPVATAARPRRGHAARAAPTRPPRPRGGRPRPARAQSEQRRAPPSPPRAVAPHPRRRSSGASAPGRTGLRGAASGPDACAGRGARVRAPSSRKAPSTLSPAIAMPYSPSTSSAVEARTPSFEHVALGSARDRSTATILSWFSVSVPVLSVAITLAEPSVSTADSRRTTRRGRPWSAPPGRARS